MLLRLRTSRCCLLDKERKGTGYGGKGYRLRGKRVPTTGEMKFEVKLYLSDIINNFRFILYLAGGHTWYTEHTNVRRALKARPPFPFFSRVHPSVVPK